ncbi:MAG: ABC transporter substrate-binding protein [Phototrophicaceae bacterium]
MKILKTIILTSLFICLLVPITSLAQDELQEETLLMTFIPNIQFAPTYVAMEAGYFEAAGFDVSVEYLDEPQVVDLVAAGENQFGIVSGEQVILAASQGRPVVYIYEWFQQFPIGIVYSDTLDVESITDLIDQRFGIPGRFGATYSGFITLLDSADIAETDIMLDEIGFAAPEVFCVGAVDASVIYVNNEPLQIRNRAQNGDCGDVSGVNVLRIGEVIDLVSNGIVTNQDMIANNPEQVTNFIAAYNQGLAVAINNPAQAYLLSAIQVEGLPLDDDFRLALETLAEDQETFLMTEPSREEIAQSREDQYIFLSEQFDTDTLLQFEVLLASIDLWDADQLGFTDAESWTNMQDTLVTLGQLAEVSDISALFTNDYLPMMEE